ncbi:MAG: tetrahydrofolate dehydrogenase/cyclohydrolase catalytic domain-containing protein, partial [Bacteroidia bacterium]
MGTIIDGKALALKLRESVKDEVANIVSKGHRAPHLAAIIVGEDGASKTYVNSKERDCEFVGFESTVHRLPAETTEDELLELIASINTNEDIDGLICQL